MLKHIELEWKILALACVLLLGFAWPVNQLFVSRLSTMLQQSVDPHLESLLRTQLDESDGPRRDSVVASLERTRQWQAIIPILIREQRIAVLSLSLALFLGLSVFALVTLNRMTRPLKTLARAVKQIGKGERADVAVVSGGALGTVEAAVVSLQDELDVLREQSRVQGMEAAWKDIARVMAHEIKNPLTPIRLTLDSVEEKVAQGTTLNAEQMIHYLSRVNAQVDALERLVNQFRSFSREPEATLRPLDLRACVDRASGDMAESLTCAVDGAATALADSYLMDQVLLNLWKNALEAGADQLQVRMHEDKTRVVLSVTDNGPGIPREHLERVWLPYVTFKKGGTGLGLPVVRRMVEHMGGRVTLQSPPAGEERGTRIVLELPCAERGGA